MSFEKLMEDLELLAKAQPDADADEDGDAKIAAAAGEDAAAEAAAASGGEGGDDADLGEDDAGPDVGGDDDEGEPMGKSLSFTLEDGTTVEAIDGTELVKSLIHRVEITEADMTKALGTAVDLIKSQGEQLKEQSELIKSLQEQVKALAGEGRGRKAVVSVTERPSVLKKSEPEGITPDQFMAKAIDAMRAGRLTGHDVARAESYLNRGMDVPADIVARVAAQ